jgi:hypothetical protein
LVICPSREDRRDAAGKNPGAPAGFDAAAREDTLTNRWDQFFPRSPTGPILRAFRKEL